MNQNKTIPTSEDVLEFIARLEDADKRADSLKLVRLMGEITGEPPKMWGSSIIGFGSYHYKYATGREGDTTIVGFSPRKQALTLYGVIFYDNNTKLLDKLGPHKQGKGCLYVKRLSDIDLDVLTVMIKDAYASKKQ
ncbi:MAG TPA: DUF1801 domain-containing protein [Candidatus Polarisedimenticolaceae bacterium]|nr:DUF1801 domain-containing protein [Candidatus Polarisedimenticolaceae bacterium]